VNELGPELDGTFSRVVRHDAATEAIPCLEHEDAHPGRGELARGAQTGDAAANDH